MFKLRSSLLALFIASLAVAAVSFVAGLLAAIWFGFPAQFFFIGLAFVGFLEAHGISVTNRPALPVSFFAWWFVVLVLMVGRRAWRTKKLAV